MAQNDGIYITNCTLEDEDIIIPEEIAGKKVIGITSLGHCYDTKSITIPDSVKRFPRTHLKAVDHCNP